MDALRFGRWLSERRRSRGWPSQQALAVAAGADERLCELGISEAFLARLEAGLLAFPFRGAVRGRVLGLAWLLCATPRELSAYLRGAGLTDLNREEADELASLRAALESRRRPAPMLLPPRPRHLFGRHAALAELVAVLQSGQPGLYAVTGTPGVGKSALACAAVHAIAGSERLRTRLFPDGIVTLSCTGRQGVEGLAALLAECCAIFAPTRDLAPSLAPVLDEQPEVVDIAHAINRARTVLAGKRVLLLLDNVEPGFPLRMLLESVVVGGYERAAGEAAGAGQPGQVVLATTYVTPVSVLPAYRVELAPLAEDDGVGMLSALIGRPLEGIERRAAAEVCAAAAYLPLSIEIAANAILTYDIHLPALAHRLVGTARGGRALTPPPPPQPMDDEALHTMLLKTLDTYARLTPQTREHFAWLAGLGAQDPGGQPALAGQLRSNAAS